MPIPVIIAVQWLHVVLGIYWFGTILYLDTILLPTLSTLPLPDQQKFGGLIGQRTDRALGPVSLTVVLLGIVRGTVFGHLQTLDAIFGSAYGITWFIALLLGVGLILWARLVLGPTVRALNTFKSPEQFSATVTRLKVLTLLELVGFVAIFTCMILMRFGL